MLNYQTVLLTAQLEIDFIDPPVKLHSFNQMHPLSPASLGCHGSWPVSAWISRAIPGKIYMDNHGVFTIISGTTHGF